MTFKPLDTHVLKNTTRPSTATDASLRSFVTQARASRTSAGAKPLLLVGSAAANASAAATVAGELERPLVRIDLSALTGKFIGETEKNLDRVFAANAQSQAVLFFDEADALFGKRSDVKDSHDRYANQEVSYLLQRIEAYAGVAIVASNRKPDPDDAVMRRFGTVAYVDPPP